MHFNVFEGARRLSYLVAALGVIGAAIGIWNDKPDLRLSYDVRHPVAPPVKSQDQDCSSPDHVEWSYLKTPGGHSYGRHLCFRASAASDGRQLIPYKMQSDTSWLMGDVYATEVSMYMRTRDERFATPPADLALLDAGYDNARFKNVAASAGWLLLGLLGWQLFAMVVGWIVRGFAGIPMGKDFRQPPNAAE